MRKLPIGNDQPIRWTVTVSGKPFNLEGLDVHVYVVNSRGEIPLRSIKVEGAVVSGVFEGRYQTRLGGHSLILRVNEGRPEMKTASVANVFELVKWSADAGGFDEGDVIITPVLLESELSIGSVSYDDKELREAIEDLEQKKVNKADLATINGKRIDEGGNIEIGAGEGHAVLYTEQSLSDAQKSQARENIGVSEAIEEAIEEAIAEIPAPESDVFKAIYGTTTYEEVSEAYNQGKIVHCDYESRCYELAVFTGNVAWFSCLNTTTSFLLTLNADSSWSKASYGLENTGNRVDTIQADAKPFQYPSAKAVYDFVQSSIINVLNEEV